MTVAGDTSPTHTIYLVNQFSRLGHLDLYARLYSACALELGYRVVLIAEQESGVKAWLDEHGYATARFRFFSRESLSTSAEPASGFLGRVSHAWRREGVVGLARRVGPSLASRSLGIVRLIPGASRIIGTRLRGKGISFAPLVEEILAAEAASGWPASLVFFLYLDMMNEDRDGRRALDTKLQRPWAGIVFHPRRYDSASDVSPERYFETRTARGAAFLNPHRIEPYSRAFPAKVFGLVPDVTDARTSAETPAMVAEITRRAKGRTIVALIGSLGADKGLMEFLRLIERADQQRFFFVLVGQIFWASLGADEPTLRRFASQPPENCFVHVGYLDDERQLNSMISAADILYAVYPHQRDSANSLTKAALLERPLVVNEAYLMGERVREFDIGAAVRYGAVDELVQALETLRGRPRASFGFAAYAKAHSTEALKDSFGSLVSRWIRTV
jgi:hypothetical protein